MLCLGNYNLSLLGNFERSHYIRTRSNNGITSVSSYQIISLAWMFHIVLPSKSLYDGI